MIEILVRPLYYICKVLQLIDSEVHWHLIADKGWSILSIWSTAINLALSLRLWLVHSQQMPLNGKWQFGQHCEQKVQWAMLTSSWSTEVSSSPFEAFQQRQQFHFFSFSEALRCWLVREIRKQCTEGRLLTIVQQHLCALYFQHRLSLDWLPEIASETLADYLKYCAMFLLVTEKCLKCLCRIQVEFKADQCLAKFKKTFLLFKRYFEKQSDATNWWEQSSVVAFIQMHFMRIAASVELHFTKIMSPSNRRRWLLKIQPLFCTNLWMLTAVEWATHQFTTRMGLPVHVCTLFVFVCLCERNERATFKWPHFSHALSFFE